MMRAWRSLFRLWRSERGTAAAEMALVTPLLLVLLFGSFELGKYFFDEHIVIKAVRDGARYAGRQTFANMACGAVTSGVETQIKNLVRTGTTDGSGTPRLPYWTSNATVTVSTSCDTTTAYSGIYAGLAGGVPRVTVSVTVPYRSLFGGVGVSLSGLNIVAQSQAVVTGI